MDGVWVLHTRISCHPQLPLLKWSERAWKDNRNEQCFEQLGPILQIEFARSNNPESRIHLHLHWSSLERQFWTLIAPRDSDHSGHSQGHKCWTWEYRSVQGSNLSCNMHWFRGSYKPLVGSLHLLLQFPPILESRYSSCPQWDPLDLR